LAERRTGRTTSWVLGSLDGPPGAATPVLAEAETPDALGQDLPAPLLPVAGFTGTSRGAQANGADLTLLQGEIRAITESLPICRLLLSGPAAAITALALDITGTLRLNVPAESLAAAALTAALRPIPPGPADRPKLTPDLSLGAACALMCAHLTAVILRRGEHLATSPTAIPAEPEHVHQMRVALRRLRSALTVFGRALPCAELDTARAGLKALAAVLGPARDWDVFSGGTAPAVAAAFPDDPAVRRLLAAADRRRATCHGDLRAYLASPAYRRLGITLAALAATTPWENTIGPEGAPPPDDLETFATHALSRALRRLLAPGTDIEALPEDELHAIRLQAKRLRYAAEMFAPLFPRRDAARFLRRLSALQEVLGHLNDGAVAASLMDQLGPAVAHGFGAGAARGFIAAGIPDAREAIARSWRRLRHAEPFWT
jgi:CHAD domain-containing protein